MYTKILGVQFVQPLPPKKKKTNYVKMTGYGATGTGIASILAIKSQKPKLHKHSGYLAGMLTLAHIGIIEWSHYQYKKLIAKPLNQNPPKTTI